MFVVLHSQRVVHILRDTCKMGEGWSSAYLFLFAWALMAGFVMTLLDFLLSLPEQK